MNNSKLDKGFSGNVIYIEPIHVLEQSNINFSVIQDIEKEPEIYKLLKKEPSKVNHCVLEEYQEITQASQIADEIISDVIKAKLITTNDSLFCKDNGTDAPINLENVASGMKSLLMIQRLIKNGSLFDDISQDVANILRNKKKLKSVDALSIVKKDDKVYFIEFKNTRHAHMPKNELYPF